MGFFYGLLKIHKNNYPIRPVCSYINAPCKKLSSALIPVINQFTKFSSKFSIKNSFELINKIKVIQINGSYILASFDVKNRFPSIPSKEVYHIVNRLLQDTNTNPVIAGEILQLLLICLDQNYLQFNGMFYKQNDGLPMGSPLSPLLAEIFMNNLELQIQTLPLAKNLVYWYRYVDDVLILWRGTTRQLSTFHKQLNALHKNIKFTLEIEQENTINYLDLKITRDNNRHRFAIYHKPTHTDMTIHNTSSHPQSHKLAAYRSMVHILLKVPMSVADYEEELKRIKTVARNNGFSEDMVNRLVKDKKQENILRSIFPTPKETKNNYAVLTYLGKETYKLTKLIKKPQSKNSF